MKKSFNKKLTTLVLPIALQQFMLALVGASDAVMLGMLNQDSMSAVSLAVQIQFVFGLFLCSATSGASILAAQYWGSQNTAAIERVLGIVYRFFVPVFLIFTLCSALIPTSLMYLFTSDAVLISYGADYLKAVSMSFLFCGISQIYMCIMRNSGRVLKCSLITIVCVIINIALNAILIFGLFDLPRLGTAGAAIATVITRIIEFIWTLCDSLPNGRIKIRFKFIVHADRVLQTAFIKYAMPVLGNEIVWGVGYTMGTVILGHLGNDAVAASSIANIAKNLVVCFCIGIGLGGGILVGNELGAGHTSEAKESGDRLYKLSVISGILTGLVLLLLLPAIPLFSTLTEDAAKYLRWMLIISIFNLIGKSMNVTTISGIFCAGGDSKFGFFCDTVTLWCVVVPLGLIAAFVLDLPIIIVYLIVNLDEIIKLPAVFIHYKKYKWLKNLT